MGRPTACSCHCVECEPIVTLRSFNVANGALLWEVENFAAIARSPDQTLWGDQLRKLESPGFTTMTALLPSLWSGAAPPFNGQYNTGWPAKAVPVGAQPAYLYATRDLCKVSSSGMKTVLVSDVHRFHYVIGQWGYGSYPLSACPVASFHALGSSGFSDAWRNRGYSATNAGLVVPQGSSSPPEGLHIEDVTKIASTMRIRFQPQFLFKSQSAGSNMPKWVFNRAGTTVRFPLYATAAEVIAALGALPGVSSVTATGGPVCRHAMDVVITWADPTFTFAHAAIEYARKLLTAEIGIFDWTVAEPAVVASFGASYSWLATFTADGLGVIENAHPAKRYNWSSSPVHPWQQTGVAAWTAQPFDQMTQTFERTAVNSIGSGVVWGSVPLSRGVSSSRGGQLVLSTTRCRLPTFATNPYVTHALIDDSTGTVISTGDSLGNDFTNTDADASGSLFVRISRYRYNADANRSIPPYNTRVPYRSAVGMQSGNVGADLFQADAMFGPFPYPIGVSAANVLFGEPGLLEDFVYAGFPGTTQFWIGSFSSSSTRRNGTIVESYWEAVGPSPKQELVTFFHEPGQPAYNPEVEWRLSHVTQFLGNVTAHQQTAWMAFNVTDAAVQAELDLWYGTNGGQQVITLLFGTSDNPARSVPWFLRGPLIRIRKGGTGWAPEARQVMLEVRNITRKQTRSLVAISRTNGTIQWQRDAGRKATNVYGQSFTPTGSRFASGSVVYADDSQVAVVTHCKPVDDVVVVDGDGNPFEEPPPPPPPPPPV